MTLLLSRADVERLLTPDVCIAAVEDAFGLLAQGKVPPPGILGLHGGDGRFHVKAGFLPADRPYFAAKVNANFPQNAARFGLPTIQGAVILFDAGNGKPLAIMQARLRPSFLASYSALSTSAIARSSETSILPGLTGNTA